MSYIDVACLRPGGLTCLTCPLSGLNNFELFAVPFNYCTQGVCSMAAAYLPSILVPLVGLVFPAIAMASLFLYIEKEEIA